MDDLPSAYKVLVIGPAFAGKTSFVIRYVHGEFKNAYRTTIGGRYTYLAILSKHYNNAFI